MREHLSVFKEIARGTPLRTVLTIEWVMAVQGLLLELAQGRNISLGDGLVSYPGDTGVRIGVRKRRFGRWGGGGATTPPRPPLTVTATRPRYIPDSGVPVPEGKKRLWVTFGTVEGIMAQNWQNSWLFDIPADEEEAVFYFFAKIWIVDAPSSPTFSVSHWRIETGDEPDEHVSADWGDNGERPEYIVLPLQTVYAYGNEFFVDDVIATDTGNITLSEHVTNLIPKANGDTFVQRGFTYQRKNNG